VAPSIGLFSKLTTKPIKPSKPVLFVRKSVVMFISGVYLVHNKKMNVHIIDSNNVMKKCVIQGHYK
jgi:hypothetical protein